MIFFYVYVIFLIVFLCRFLIRMDIENVYLMLFVNLVDFYLVDIWFWFIIVIKGVF